MKPRSEWAQSLAAWGIRVALRGLGSTWRLQVVGGEAAIDRLLAQQRPVLLSFWHDQSLVVGWFLQNVLRRRDFAITLLASHSRDGEIIARVGKAWGLEAIRGSASRGGSAALRRLYRAVVRHHSSPIMIPDGPRGPIYRCKAGVVVLAQTSGAPIQPLAGAARSSWHLRSWDRMIVPRPFTTVRIVIGEALTIPSGGGAQDLAERQAEVEKRLDGTAQAARTAAVGHGDERSQGSQR